MYSPVSSADTSPAPARTTRHPPPGRGRSARNGRRAWRVGSRRPCILLTFRSACRGNAPRRAGDRRIAGVSTPEIPAWALDADAAERNRLADGRGRTQVTREWAWGGSDGDRRPRLRRRQRRRRRPPARRRRRPRGRPVAGAGRRAGRSSTTTPATSAATGRRAPGSSASLAPGCSITSVRVLGPDLGGSGGRPAGRARVGGRPALRRRQPQPLDAQARGRARPARARRPGLLRRHAARRVRAQPARRELPVALLVGALGRRPRRRATRSRSTATRTPPVEFYARGVDVEVAWAGGETITGDGQLVRHAAPRRRVRAHPRRPPRAHARSRSSTCCT